VDANRLLETVPCYPPWKTRKCTLRPSQQIKNDKERVSHGFDRRFLS
jgi:hypothetical protein